MSSYQHSLLIFSHNLLESHVEVYRLKSYHRGIARRNPPGFFRPVSSRTGRRPPPAPEPRQARLSSWSVVASDETESPISSFCSGKTPGQFHDACRAVPYALMAVRSFSKAVFSGYLYSGYFPKPYCNSLV